jgi:hypothetical protein
MPIARTDVGIGDNVTDDLTDRIHGAVYGPSHDVVIIGTGCRHAEPQVPSLERQSARGLLDDLRSEQATSFLQGPFVLPKAMPNSFDISPAAAEKLLAKVLLGDSGAARTLVDLVGPIIRRVAVPGRALSQPIIIWAK